MDLYSGDVYWYEKDDQIESYPSLESDMEVDVLIIGAGISGALIAYQLINKNLKVAVIDKRETGTGSTCASTCLLQYEIDTPISELIEKRGKKIAMQSYILCRDAIYDIQKIARHIKSKAGFEIKQSIYRASFRKDLKPMKEEYRLRKEAGISLRILDKKELKEEFNLDGHGALVSKDGGQIDAYRFTQELLKYESQQGIKIFNQTEAVKIVYHKHDVVVTTDKGVKIKAKHLVFANGYEAQNYLSKNYGKLQSTYVVVSEPLETKQFEYILWETARPYLYIRSTPDNRVIVGGKDEPFYNPVKRDGLLNSKTQQLLNAFKKIFPDTELTPDYSWTGTFAESKDGLPFIGKHKDHPHCFFSLGYGGNGITFSVIAAQLISDAILKKRNVNENIFSFNR